jgi:ParB/RepB/Spo0J family partition protein
MTTDTITLADPELISAFLERADNGEPCDHLTLTKALGRPRSDAVKRSLERAAKAGTITLDPPGAPAATRKLIDQWRDDQAAIAAHREGRALPEDAAKTGTILVSIDQLTASPFNPRKTFDEAEIAALADSILAKGLLQSPLARPHPAEKGKFQIAAGERRRRAMALLAGRGADGISADFDPAQIEIKVRELDDADMIMIGILENADRVDPSPMEEAEAFVQLRDLITKRDPGQAGKATQIIADRLGKTRRHVQLRIALAEKLVEQARKLLAENRLTLAKARALAELPAPIQAEIVAAISNGPDWLYETADDIRGAMKDHAFPASKARFTKAEYEAAAKNSVTDLEAAFWTDPDTGAEFYTLMPVVKRLQAEAVDQIEAELKAKGRAFVRIVDHFSQFDFPAATDSDTAADIGAVIEYDAHDATITVHDKRVLARRLSNAAEAEKAAEEAKAADKAKRQAAAEAAGVRLAPQPFSRKHYIAAKKAKTATLQEHIALGNPRLAAALAIIGLLDHHAICSEDAVDRDTVMITRPHRRGADTEIGSRGHIKKAMLAVAEANPAAFELTASGVVIKSPAKALKALVGRDDLSQILAAVIAEQVGTWTGHLAPGGDEGPGDSPLVLAIAEELDIEGADYETGAEYFGQFSRGTIGMMAKRITGKDDLPEARAAAAKALAEASGANAFAAPEMRFGAPDHIAADIGRLLTGGEA